MYGETTIPIREKLPDYPDSYRGKRLLGVDAYLYGHYWCGDRVEIYERQEVLREEDGAATVSTTYRKRATVPIAQLEGGLTEYVRNVGAYLDRFVDDPDEPVYADDADEWEWVSSYARDWIASRSPTRAANPREQSSAAASPDQRRYQG